MPEFQDLVKNLYTSKNRELTSEKLAYIQKTYTGKEQDFVKNFYATIGEELPQEKLDYISETYLKKKVVTQPTSSNLQGGAATPLPTSTESQSSIKIPTFSEFIFGTPKPKKEVVAATPTEIADFNEETKRALGGVPKSTDIATTVPKIQQPFNQQEALAVQEQKGKDIKQHKEEALRNTAIQALTKGGTFTKVLDKEPTEQEIIAEEKKWKPLLENGQYEVTKNEKGERVLGHPRGFFESLAERAEKSITDPIAAYDYHKAVVNDDVSKLVELKEKEKQNKEPFPKAFDNGSAANYFGGLAGDLPKLTALSAAGTVAGGGNPIVGGAAVFGAESAWTGLKHNTDRLYDELLSKNPEMDKEEAMKIALDAAKTEMIPDFATGAALGLVDAKMVNGKLVGNESKGLFRSLAEKAPEQQAKEVFINSFKNTLKGATKFGVAMGGGELSKTAIEDYKGFERKTGDYIWNTLNAAKDGALVKLAFDMVHVGSDIYNNVPKYLKATAKEYLAKQPPELINSTLESMGEKGQQIKQKLDEYRAVRQQFEGVVPEKQIGTFANWQQRINNLKAENDNLTNKLNPNITDAPQEPIKRQIEANNQEVKAIDEKLAKYLETNRITEKDPVTGEKLNTQHKPLDQSEVENNRKLDLQEIDEQINVLQKEKPQLWDIKVENLETQKKDINDYYDNYNKNFKENEPAEQTATIEEPTEKQSTIPIETETIGSTETKVDNATQPTEVSKEVADHIAELNDTETYTAYVDNVNEIPEQFRDRAKKLNGEITTRKSFLGIPYGKETVINRYKYEFTGKEAKEEFNRQQGIKSEPTQPTEEGWSKDVESTQKAFDKLSEENKKIITDANFQDLYDNKREASGLTTIEQYHNSKSKGEETNLTKAIENLLGKPTEEVKVEVQPIEVSSNVGDKVVSSGVGGDVKLPNYGKTVDTKMGKVDLVIEPNDQSENKNSIKVSAYDADGNTLGFSSAVVDAKNKTLTVKVSQIKDKYQRNGIYSKIIDEYENIAKDKGLKLERDVDGETQSSKDFWNNREKSLPTQEVKAEQPNVSKVGFTESKDLNKIFGDLKNKYGEKKGTAIYEAANRLVNPNENTIVEIRGNGVVVKEGDKYILKPFGNTDANSKKWTLYKGLDITDQFAKSEQPNVSESNPSLRDVESTQNLLDNANYSKRRKENILVRLPIDFVLKNQEDGFGVKRGENEIGNRIDKAKKFLQGNPKELEASDIYIKPTGKQAGKIGFGDGRHRLIAAKELGATHAYFEMPRTVEQFNALDRLLADYGNVEGIEFSELTSTEGDYRLIQTSDNTFLLNKGEDIFTFKLNESGGVEGGTLEKNGKSIKPNSQIEYAVQGHLVNNNPESNARNINRFLGIKDINKPIPKLDDLSKKEQKKLDEEIENWQSESLLSKEQTKTEPNVSETKVETEKVDYEPKIKEAEAKYNAAKKEFDKASKKISDTQTKQQGIFGGEQKGIMPMGREEAKAILDPLREKAKKAKAEWDDLLNKKKVQDEKQQELFDQEKTTTASANKQKYAKAREIDTPTDAHGLALEYFANGGKIHPEELLNEVVGKAGDSRLTKNTDAKKLASERKGNDLVDPNAKTVKEVAHSIWDNLPEEIQDRISDQDVRNAIIDVMGTHQTRSSVADEFIKSYHPEETTKEYEKQLAEYFKYLEEQKYENLSIDEVNDIFDEIQNENAYSEEIDYNLNHILNEQETTNGEIPTTNNATEKAVLNENGSIKENETKGNKSAKNESEVNNVFTESDNPQRESKSKKALIDAKKEVFEKYKEEYGDDVKDKVKDINTNFDAYTKALKEIGEIIKIEC